MNTAISVAMLVGIGYGLYWLLAYDTRERRADIERRHKTPPPPVWRDPLEAGTRVRILVAIPEFDIEPGRLGRVKLVDYGDDTRYFVKIDNKPGASVIFFDAETWQIEVVR